MSSNQLKSDGGRPRIDLPFSQSDFVLMGVSAALLVAQFVYILAVWEMLPERVPTHFGLSGAPDAWGAKGMLILLPAIAAVMFFLLTFITRIPHIYNYSTTVTEENAPFLYRNARTTLLLVCLFLTVLFGLLLWESVQIAWGNAEKLTVWYIPSLIILILVTVLVRTYAAHKKAKGL